MAENSILNQIPFDPAYILIGLAVLVLMLLIVVIVMIQRFNPFEPQVRLFYARQGCGDNGRYDIGSA